MALLGKKKLIEEKGQGKERRGIFVLIIGGTPNSQTDEFCSTVAVKNILNESETPLTTVRLNRTVLSTVESLFSNIKPELL